MKTFLICIVVAVSVIGALLIEGAFWAGRKLRPHKRIF
jgi:hypothetical protein